MKLLNNNILKYKFNYLNITCSIKYNEYLKNKFNLCCFAQCVCVPPEK